jgi:EAL domain-containing protein (putative c-di-GMP-specific phosphodiesterase class I)
LDDFGTGYSALSYLRELPFDKIKIDRSFIRDIDTDPKAHALVEGMVALCDTLGMRTVAEGVETREQRERLASMYIDEFQGYLFARPMALSDLLRIRAPIIHSLT